MGDGHINLLPKSWCVELTEKGKEHLATYLSGYDATQAAVEEYIKDFDLRKAGISAKLPKDLVRFSGALPVGQYLVQVQKIVDITQPAKFQEDFEGGKWRLLTFDLSDGEQKFKALEYIGLNQSEFNVQVPPGMKLLLTSPAGSPLYCQNGHVLLRPDCVQKIGGRVESLAASWEKNKEAEEGRLLWRTEGVKTSKGAEGAPPWVDFDPKKAPRGGLKLEEERKEWATTGGATVGQAKPANPADEEAGPRFHVQEFAKDGDAPLRSIVTSSAFKQDFSKGKGKGKGKKGDDEGGGRRGRKGGGDDDDYGEEKRAPTHATSSLFDFIKPTKDGMLPDAAKQLLAEPIPAKAKTSSDAAGGASWTATSGAAAAGWAAASWDESNSGWGAQDWGSSGAGWSSGGGWSESGGGGGRGKGKGGGGGGKSGGGRKGGGGGKKGGRGW